METDELSLYYEPYRRVPMNSATTQRDYNDFNSIGSYSTYSLWSRPMKRTMTTTYIDGTTMLNQYNRPYDIKNLFPKGKNRQKPLQIVEKKNARDAYMSLLPTDAPTIRSEKPRSPLSTGTGAHISNLPEVLPKTPSTSRNNRSACRTTIFDDDSQSKFYTRCATTHANNAWVRRFKSINESQILSNFLRDHINPSKVLLKQRSYKEIKLSSSSTNSFNSSNKLRLQKCS